MGGSGNLRAKQQRGAAVRKGKCTRRPAAPAATTPDDTPPPPVDDTMDKGKIKQPDGSMIGYDASMKKPSRNASSSTHPPPSSIELAKSIRSLKVILSVSAKILRAAAVEKIPITEAMPDIPGWFEGSKAVCEEVLDRYGGLASAGGKVGEMIDMAVRAREVLEEIEEAGGLGREGRT